MIIETALLSTGPARFEGEEDGSFLELEDDDSIRAPDPARYRFAAQVTSSRLVVKGSIKIQLISRCARCDEWTPHTISVPDFERTYKLKSGNDSIDLTDDIREDILLAFPMRFTCSSSCLGLCPQCGANLNRQKCSCARREEQAGWNALEQLEIDR